MDLRCINEGKSLNTIAVFSTFTIKKHAHMETNLKHNLWHRSHRQNMAIDTVPKYIITIMYYICFHASKSNTNDFKFYRNEVKFTNH